MRPLLSWLVAASTLLFAAVHSLHSIEPRPAQASQVELPDDRAALEFVYVPLAAPIATPPLTVPNEAWCEPLDYLPCVTQADCPTAPEGTPFHCVEPWWVGAPNHDVCVAGFPDKAVRRWRSARLRVLVDEICQPSDGCNPTQLHAYLTTLAMRETTLRPYKVHRLAGDLKAAQAAWSKLRDQYVDSPAASEPQRWASGRGYFGQNPALLLHVWDAAEIPEALCGEVESTLVHLRTARDRWQRLDKGVTCGGREHHGTATGGHSSWYDISLVNSGSNACPATTGHALEVRRGFERRAKSRGLDPYGSVALRKLGRPIAVSEQREFASRVRRKMGAVPLPRTH